MINGDTCNSWMLTAGKKFTICWSDKLQQLEAMFARRYG